MQRWPYSDVDMQTLVAMLFLAAPDDFLSMDLGSSLFLNLGSAFREMLGLAELSCAMP